MKPYCTVYRYTKEESVIFTDFASLVINLSKHVLLWIPTFYGIHVYICDDFKIQSDIYAIFCNKVLVSNGPPWANTWINDQVRLTTQFCIICHKEFSVTVLLPGRLNWGKSIHVYIFSNSVRMVHTDGFVQDCGISIPDALEMQQSCIKTSTWPIWKCGACRKNNPIPTANLLNLCNWTCPILHILMLQDKAIPPHRKTIMYCNYCTQLTVI